MSWVPLREHLREHVLAQIADEPDAVTRSLIAGHLERIVDLLELLTLRQIVAERDVAAARPAPKSAAPFDPRQRPRSRREGELTVTSERGQGTRAERHLLIERLTDRAEALALRQIVLAERDQAAERAEHNAEPRVVHVNGHRTSTTAIGVPHLVVDAAIYPWILCRVK
jgi:hypothetical protein